jgi:hypothetical protein
LQPDETQVGEITPRGEDPEVFTGFEDSAALHFDTAISGDAIALRTRDCEFVGILGVDAANYKRGRDHTERSFVHRVLLL